MDKDGDTFKRIGTWKSTGTRNGERVRRTGMGNGNGDGKRGTGIGNWDGEQEWVITGNKMTAAVTGDGWNTSPSILIKLPCLFVCMFVCPQTTPREINEYRQIIHHWKRNFPGTKVIYFRTTYDYLVRKYTKKTNFGPPKYFDFFP